MREGAARLNETSVSVRACLSKGPEGGRAVQTSKRRLFLGVGTSRAKDLRQKSWRDETTGAGEGGHKENQSAGP